MFKEKKSIMRFKWDKLLEDKDFKRSYLIFLKEAHPNLEETCWDRKWTKDYCDNLLREITRRETKYGRKKKGGEDDDEPVIKNPEDEDANAEGSPRAKHDPYKLSMPDFPVKLTAE